MSSILKALKKLEKEPAAGVEIRSLSKTLDTTKVFKKPRQERRPMRIVYLVVQVLIIGGGIALFGLNLLHNQEGQFGVPGQKTNIFDAGEATPDTSEHGATVRPLTLKEPPDPVSGRQTGRMMAESGRIDTNRSKQQTGTIREKGDRITRTEDQTGNPATRIEITPAVVDSQTSLSTAARPLLPRLDHSILRLQAVTWAVDPQKRFALVDNTILRKGESIKGFVVDTIQEDHIVVGKGGEKWRVEFRLR